MNYRPLPDTLTIKRSKVDGLGLFATKPIRKGKILGITHIKNDHKAFKDGLIRTPLGGFINHSEFPNCEIVELNHGYILKTLVQLIIGEELTLKYKWYDPTS
tara:strand:- start:561 stop:866 length:306 start_codon:yes stop_codon:yes gene_type:complete